MTFTKERIYDYVEENLHNISTGDLIDIHNDELGGNHVGFISDFDDYVRYDGFLDTYNSLSSGFDSSEEYFCYDGEYQTSDDIGDFIEMDEVVEWITNFFTSEDANDIDAGTEYGLYELWKPLKEMMDAEEKPKHTEEEIKAMLKDTILDLPPSMLVDLLKLDGMDIAYMHDFTERAKLHSIPAVIGKLAFSIGWFEFGDIAYEETDERYISYSSPTLAEEVCKRFDGITDEQLKNTGFDALVQIRHGEW